MTNKNHLLPIVTFLAALLFAVSCDQDDKDLADANSDLSQIEKLEKAESTTFFKKDFTYEGDGTEAVLTVATRNEELFKNVIENLEVTFTPVLEGSEQSKPADSGTDSPHSEETPEAMPALTDEVMVEFTKMKRAAGVIGIQTTYKIKKTDASNGRPGSHGYNFYVNHYSGHWPSTYSLETITTANRTGAHFYARWKWYQGYGSRTVCIISSWCSMVGACAQDFDLYGGNCKWTWNVDGPYQMQAKIGWFSGDSWRDSWTY